LSFIAEAFSPRFGTEMVPGRIVVDPKRLRFEAGNIRVEMPLSRVQIESDEAAPERICFSDPEQAEWSICTYDQTILRAWPLQQQTNTRTQIRQIQSRGEL